MAAHQQLKVENEMLRKENEQLTKSVEAEKARTKWVEDGYNSLHQSEKSKKDKTIKQLQNKLENIISDMDKNIALIETNNE